MTPTDTPTLNFRNRPSEQKSRHPDAKATAAAPDRTPHVVIADWEARSIAVVAKLTAPLHLRRSTRQLS